MPALGRLKSARPFDDRIHAGFLLKISRPSAASPVEAQVRVVLQKNDTFLFHSPKSLYIGR